MVDILIFAVIAFYLFFKLSKQLGKIDEGEKKDLESKIQQKLNIVINPKSSAEAERVVGFSSTNEKIDAPILLIDPVLQNLDSKIREEFLEIMKRCAISSDFFINGAKSAFEMILKAFSVGDFAVLKLLLSERLFLNFEQVINQRIQQKQTLVTNLISIEKAEVVSAEILGSNASIAIRFRSKQINYLANENGEIISGKRNEIVDIVDIWTFRKDLSLSNPNWVVVSKTS